jgi:hypothetical protein
MPRKPAQRQGPPQIAENMSIKKSNRIRDLRRNDDGVTAYIARQAAWRLHVEFSTRARTADAARSR